MKHAGGLETYQVLLSTLVTEKSTHQRAKLNKFSFRVPVAATKPLIKRAVHEAFGVRVTSVTTQYVKERSRRYRTHLGQTSCWKKAVVTLPKEETLPV
jgi:large subunit ribosomal protein L23